MKIKCLIQCYEDHYTNEEINAADVVLVPVEHEGVKSFMMIKNRVGDVMQVVGVEQLGEKLFEIYLNK